MTRPFVAAVARHEITEAVAWIAKDSPRTARRFRSAIDEALGRVGRYPLAGHERPDLTGSPLRFWQVVGFPYFLIYRADVTPPRVVRFFHAARNISALLD